MTLFEFYDKYFSVNLKDYHNIGIDLQISKLLFCVFIGLIIVAIAINLRKSAVISLVKKLMLTEIFCESDAQTLTELGVNNFSTRIILNFSNHLIGIVMMAGVKNYTLDEYKLLKKSGELKREKIDFKEARFYLNRDALDKAQKIVDIPEPSILHTVFFCILLLAIYVYITFMIPELLTFINNVMSK